MLDFKMFQWIDHIINGEQTYSLQEVPEKPGHYRLIADPIDVIQEGTPLSQSKLGMMNDGIAFAHFVEGSILGEVLQKLGVMLNDRVVDFQKRLVQGSGVITGNPNSYLSSAYPFVLVSLPVGSEYAQTNTPNYDVNLNLVSADDINAVGNLEVYDKASNGFKVRYTGSAKTVSFTWTIINTKII